MHNFPVFFSSEERLVPVNVGGKSKDHMKHMSPPGLYRFTLGHAKLIPAGAPLVYGIIQCLLGLIVYTNCSILCNSLD